MTGPLAKFALLAAAIVVCGCTGPAPPPVTAIIGGALIDGTGGPIVPDSVVLVQDGRILAAGSRETVPVNAAFLKEDARGLFVAPIPGSGPVAPGRPARLLLLAGNPIEDPKHWKNIRRMMDRGEWVAATEGR